MKFKKKKKNFFKSINFFKQNTLEYGVCTVIHFVQVSMYNILKCGAAESLERQVCLDRHVFLFRTNSLAPGRS